MLGEDVCGWN